MTFKYPMAGDVAAKLTTRLTANPTDNPWEVHSSSGLEGTFADRDDADHLAGELRRSGAKDVRVKAKDRLRPPRLPGAPPMYHTPQGRPPGVPNPRRHPNPPVLHDVRVGGRILRGWSPSEITFEVAADLRATGDEAGAAEVLRNELGHYAIAIIYMGMARALWVTSYADWVENMVEDKAQRDLGPGPGGEWDDVTPDTPESADQAAEDLVVLIERANNASTGDPTATLMDLYYRAVEADAAIFAAAPFVPDEKYAEEFGHYLAMEALGHGVSWRDDHAPFSLRMPHLECYSGDGETVDWSPHVIRREPAMRPAPRAARRVAREIAKSKKNPGDVELWRVWFTKRPEQHFDVDAPSATNAILDLASDPSPIAQVLRSMRGVVVEINARPIGSPTGATTSFHVRLGRDGRMEIVR